MVNRELADCADNAGRLRALGRNHALWSILVKDLALAENRLPDGLKGELIELGLWSMHYSTVAMLQNLSMEPLIQVNRNIADGLAIQGAIAPQTSDTLKATLSI